MDNVPGQDAQLAGAHGVEDFSLMVTVYYDHALAIIGTDLEAGCYYLTIAYVYALVSGHKKCEAIRELLVSHGREE